MTASMSTAWLSSTISRKGMKTWRRDEIGVRNNNRKAYKDSPYIMAQLECIISGEGVQTSFMRSAASNAPTNVSRT